MLKVIVYGDEVSGKLFVEKLEAELQIVDVIRITNQTNGNLEPRKAKSVAEQILMPYIDKVDLIVFADYLLSATSLRYFQKKYKTQKFVGFTFNTRQIILKRPTLIIATKAITKNLAYFGFSRQIKAKTIHMDTWPELVKNRELTLDKIRQDLETALARFGNFSPQQVLLYSGKFSTLIPELRQCFGHNVRVVDCYNDILKDTFKALGLRGGDGKKKK